VAAQVLNALALASLLAAVSVFVLMCVDYFSVEEYDRDWPGRYWYAILPLLVAATSLAIAAWRFEPLDDAPGRNDWD
jgi:formate hydrogenlyase subunit 3/multisubunit Na+/H+ antiporter MnhD subunit